MKQIVQNVRTGALTIETVPPPAVPPGFVRVRTAASLISAGTERAILDLAQKSLLGKAWSRPDLVRKVFEKARKEGWRNALEAVRVRMDKPLPLGYSAAGVVEAVGEGVSARAVGDRVAVAGAGYANHAEMNVVPVNLTAPMPDGVAFDEAAYATVASVALQGLRLARPELGDRVAVIGLGLIGLLAVQLLKANGCRVLGVDLDAAKVDLGRTVGLDRGVVLGDDEPEAAADRLTGGRGVDATLIAASTEDNGPIELAGRLTRRKGRVVAVGAVGMDVPRPVYYEKELDLQVSMSYGPGRYDPSYEEGGIDYPFEYVRWTEQRNMEAVLHLMAGGDVDAGVLTTHRFAFGEALDAYALVTDADPSSVGVVLTYDLDRPQPAVVRTAHARANGHAKPRGDSRFGIGFVGAGTYATRFLLPPVAEADEVDLVGLVTGTGISGPQHAERFGFRYCTTDLDVLLGDDAVDAVFIATRHGTHADFACRALRAGKHVFVEKPLAVTESQLTAIVETYQAAVADRPLGFMVGLNRRFAPMLQTLQEAVGARGPLQMVYRVNSGAIDPDAWVYRPEEGGGMLVGETCHFIDVMQALCGARPVRVYADRIRTASATTADADNLSLTIGFADGSTGVLCYNTIGDEAASKERFEVFGGGTAAALDDYRRLEITTDGRTDRTRAWNQDKGQDAQVAETLRSFRKRGAGPIPFQELVAGMQVVFAARRSMEGAAPVELAPLVVASGKEPLVSSS